MALTDLTQGDFDWFKTKVKRMIDCHEKEFIKQIDPDLMRAFYRGKNKKEKDASDQEFYQSRKHYLTMSQIFQATNTLVPQLYYQNPSPIITPSRGSDADSAALMTAILKFYMKHNESKRNNQEAILNTWFFGLGWKKIGYRTVFLPRVDEPETKLSPMDMMKNGAMSIMGMKPDSNEANDTPDIVDYEELFNTSENPMHVMLDDSTDIYNGKYRLHRLPRTLNDLELFGNYDEATLQELYKKYRNERGSRMDSRDVNLTLNELHIKQRNGMWILSYVDGFDKPLRYEPSTDESKDFSLIPLILTNEPGIRYPISHMKVASQVQEQLDYLATLYIRIIDRMRNQVVVDRNAIQPGTEKAWEANKTGGILWTNRPVTSGVFAQVTSAAVQNDLPALMQFVQQNLTEILGADKQLIAGTSKNKTLGQDELARVGTKVRESGMQDKIREWMITQLRREAILIKQFSNTQLHLQITGKDYVDQMTGKSIEEKWVSFMTSPQDIPPQMASNPNFHFTPMGAKEFLQGEFDFDINIYEAILPDKKAKQAEYAQALSLFANPAIQQSVLMDQAKVHIGKLAEGYADQFEFLKSSEFIEKLDPLQAASAQAQAMLMQNPQMASSMSQPKLQEKKDVNQSNQGVSNPSSEAANV